MNSNGICSRSRETVAAEFLRKALAGGAVGVPEIDMVAHEAGLLGPS